MPRFWVSFWADSARSIIGHDEGLFFNTGERDQDPAVSVCAVIDARTEVHLWDYLRAPQHFPELEERFCNLKDDGWMPGDRFPGAKVLTI